MHQEIELGLAAFVKVGFHEQETVAAKRRHIELAQLQTPIEALGKRRVIELLVPHHAIRRVKQRHGVHMVARISERGIVIGQRVGQKRLIAAEPIGVLSNVGAA